jgi:hypothetical protein
MFTKEKTTLMPYLQPFGRLGIVMIRKNICGKWKEKGKRMMMIGYAPDHKGDTYKMFDPLAKTMQLSRDIKWLEWKTLDPYREMSIFNQQPDINNVPGIDDKEYTPLPPPAPNIIPDNGDAGSKAGRIVEEWAEKVVENENENKNKNKRALQPGSNERDVEAMRAAVTALAKSTRLGQEMQKLAISFNPEA